MKYYSTQSREYDNRINRRYIKEHLFDCYQKLCMGEDINYLMSCHKKEIILTGINGKNKNKYKTLSYLEQYKNTRNKTDAMTILTNTVRGFASNSAASVNMRALGV